MTVTPSAIPSTCGLLFVCTGGGRKKVPPGISPPVYWALEFEAECRAVRAETWLQEEDLPDDVDTTFPECDDVDFVLVLSHLF